MLKQIENNWFRAVLDLSKHKCRGTRDWWENIRCLWFLWSKYLACDWLQHNKHSRHILGVHANIITAVFAICEWNILFWNWSFRKEIKDCIVLIFFLLREQVILFLKWYFGPFCSEVSFSCEILLMIWCGLTRNWIRNKSTWIYFLIKGLFLQFLRISRKIEYI